MEFLYEDFNEIINVVNQFLSPFELTCEFNEDFAYFPMYNLVGISLITIDRASRNFLHFVEDEFNDVHADIFLWSLLHEVGHHETWDDLTNEEMNLSQEMKYAISDCENLRPNDRDKIYFYIPDEYLATEWAAQYMRDNVQEVTKFWNTLQPLILNFYKKHGIER